MSEKKDDKMADDARTQLADAGLAGDQGVAPVVVGSDPAPEPSPDSDIIQDAGTNASGVGAASEPVTPDQIPSPTQLRLRRAPRYRPFGITGAVLGVLAGVVLALSFTAASDYSMQTIVGYFAAIFGLIGAVVGLGVAVLIERRRPERGRS